MKNATKTGLQRLLAGLHTLLSESVRICDLVATGLMQRGQKPISSSASTCRHGRRKNGSTWSQSRISKERSVALVFQGGRRCLTRAYFNDRKKSSVPPTWAGSRHFVQTNAAGSVAWILMEKGRLGKGAASFASDGVSWRCAWMVEIDCSNWAAPERDKM